MGIKNRTEKKKASGVEWGKGGNLSCLRQYRYDFARKTRHVAVAGEALVGSGQSGTAAIPGERAHCFSQGIGARHQTKPTHTPRAGPQGEGERLCGYRGWLNLGATALPSAAQRGSPWEAAVCACNPQGRHTAALYPHTLPNVVTQQWEGAITV